MTRKSKRELERALEDLEPYPDALVTTPVPDSDEARSFLEEEIERARKVLPEERVERLDTLVNRINDEGPYADDGELTTASKQLLSLVFGEAAGHGLRDV